MKKLLLATMAVFALSAGSASAADLARPVAKAPPPPPAPVYSWTGCYVGAGGGYGMYDIDSQQINAVGAPIALPFDQGGRGGFVTAQVGCDVQASPRFVIGAFADWDWSGIRGDFTGNGGAVGLNTGELQLRHSWAAGGRVGWLVTPQLLTFVSGGYTQARFSGVDYANLNGPVDVSLSAATYSGYFIGSGVEYNFGWHPSLTWRTEYRFADYSSKDVAEFRTSTGALTGNVSRNHPYVQTIRSELVWRFNLGGPVVAKY
jgi:outer membrane immunogenic protein